MLKRSSALVLALAMLTALAPATLGAASAEALLPNVLVNGSFEYGQAAWTVNAQGAACSRYGLASAWAAHGEASFYFETVRHEPAVCAIHQDAVAVPGVAYAAAAALNVVTLAADGPALVLSFLDALGQPIASERQHATSLGEQGLLVEGVAPIGAAKVRFQVAMSPTDASAAFIDDARLTATP